MQCNSTEDIDTVNTEPCILRLTIMNNRRIHLVAIGGSAMHNLALALKSGGFEVTGSDDEIEEPSLSRLRAGGLLPEKEGWFPDKITPEIHAVILGMHARADNPELLKAKELGLKIYSYPEYLYEASRNKCRVVIGGSHGKTTITSMILSVMKYAGKDVDFMVGARLEGFDTMVRLSDAPVIILEGDEYLSSALDRRPKFHLYHANIGLISGIAWDHINVFPKFDNYVEQFRIFAEQIPSDGQLLYCEEDEEVRKLVRSSSIRCSTVAYNIPEYHIEGNRTVLHTAFGEIPVYIFGKHNLMNLEGARKICNLLGVNDREFYFAIQEFKGASGRLEKVLESENLVVFRDFAHSPSKLKATIAAVRQQYPGKHLTACMELHTFSSLSDGFLDEYKNSMNDADTAIVYFNPHTIAHKKLTPISEDRVRQAFGTPSLQVLSESAELKRKLMDVVKSPGVLLLMSSGTFDGLDIRLLSENALSDINSGNRTNVI